MGNILKTGIIILAISLLSIVGYLTYTGQYGLKEDGGKIASQLQRINPFRQKDNGETANWKTHKSENLGYKIKYPDEAEPTSEENNVVSFVKNNDSENIYILSITGGSLGEKSLNDFVNDQAEAHEMLPMISSVEEFEENLNNQNVLGFTTIGEENSQSRKFTYLPVENNNYILIIDQTTALKNDDLKEIVRKMLTTFRLD